MRVRIIFRGLTLFKFDAPTKDATPKTDLGTLTAWLISDPAHADMPRHAHRPYLGLIGRDRDAPFADRMETKRRIWNDLRIELKGHNQYHCVTADQTFLDYVPCLDALGWGPPKTPREDLITRRIVIPHGTIRARDFISWDSYGTTPSRIAYMKTSIVGYATNDVVVDIGDDSDIDDNDPAKYLALASVDGTLEYERLWPRAKGNALDEDIDPNTVELVISNLPARRRRAVFWGKHFQLHLKAAGYEPADYSNDDEYKRFAALAAGYDSYEWKEDQALGADYPFPYLIVPSNDKLPPLQWGSPPAIAVPPAPHGRKDGEGVSGVSIGGATGMPSMAGGLGVAAGMPPGHDPDNTEICPFARI